MLWAAASFASDSVLRVREGIDFWLFQKHQKIQFNEEAKNGLTVSGVFPKSSTEAYHCA